MWSTGILTLGYILHDRIFRCTRQNIQLLHSHHPRRCFRYVCHVQIIFSLVSIMTFELLSHHPFTSARHLIACRPLVILKELPPLCRPFLGTLYNIMHWWGRSKDPHYLLFRPVQLFGGTVKLCLDQRIEAILRTKVLSHKLVYVSPPRIELETRQN